MILKKFGLAAPVTFLVFPLLTQTNILLNYLSILRTGEYAGERSGCRVGVESLESDQAVGRLLNHWRVIRL
jgi:hypothetical protein